MNLLETKNAFILSHCFYWQQSWLDTSCSQLQVPPPDTANYSISMNCSKLKVNPEIEGRRWERCPVPFIYNLSPGEGGKHLCRVYCQESHTQHSQPQSVFHHFWFNLKKHKPGLIYRKTGSACTAFQHSYIASKGDFSQSCEMPRPSASLTAYSRCSTWSL